VSSSLSFRSLEVLEFVSACGILCNRQKDVTRFTTGNVQGRCSSMFAALTGEILEEQVIPFVEYDIVVTEINHPEERVSNPE